MIDIPTHTAVAETLQESHPELAELILSGELKNSCWGDLVFQAQYYFSSRYVASAIKRLSLRGWKEHIILTWCPLTDELWDQFCRVKELQDQYMGLSESEKKRASGTIYGSVALIQLLWKKTREKWMKEWSVTGDNDPNFFMSIILYLEKLGAEEKNNARHNDRSDHNG